MGTMQVPLSTLAARPYTILTCHDKLLRLKWRGAQRHAIYCEYMVSLC